MSYTENTLAAPPTHFVFSFFLLVPGFVTKMKHFHESLRHIQCSVVS